MSSVKYDANLMRTMALVEKKAKVPVKDIFTDNKDNYIIVMDEKYVSRAVGKHGKNVKHLKNLLNRNIKIVGFTTDIERFFTNLVYPLEVGVEKQGEVLLVDGKNAQTRARLIGKNGQNLKDYLQIMKRYFDIEKINVV